MTALECELVDRAVNSIIDNSIHMGEEIYDNHFADALRGFSEIL